jgi:Zn-dependent peptidase ImmA (M78 family)
MKDKINPSRLKRGIRVQIRPLLSAGMIGCDDDGILILIDSEQSKLQQNITLWHEVVHLLRDAGGVDQSEIEVEEYAKKLAEACPNAIDWTKPQMDINLAPN